MLLHSVSWRKWLNDVGLGVCACAFGEEKDFLDQAWTEFWVYSKQPGQECNHNHLSAPYTII